MNCYSLLTIENKKTGDYIQVPCGKCNFCLQNRRNDWAFRMMEEAKDSHTGHFLTLTYDREHVPYSYTESDEGESVPVGYTLKRKHLFRFLRTVKQEQRRILKKEYKDWKIRYYAVGEYGDEGERPHYHVIIFNLHPKTLKKMTKTAIQLPNGKIVYAGEYIWTKGFIHVGELNEKTVSYTAKYIIDKEQPNYERVKPFSTMSRGIGVHYIDRNRNFHREIGEYYPDGFRMYLQEGEIKKRLPRFYRDKIFTAQEGEREEVLKDAMEIFWTEFRAKMKQQYEDEIKELGKLYEKPEVYYQEKLKHKHDQIRIKSKSRNKL